MPSSANLRCTSESSQTLARPSERSAKSFRISNNSSSPTMSYNCSVALVASGPTMSSPLINWLSFSICSGVSGNAQVPSLRLLIQFSNICASFMLFPCCCILANVGKAASILASSVCSTNKSRRFSTRASASPTWSGAQDSKYA